MERIQPSANPLGREKIGRLLARYAVPSVISLVINSLYNMVDQIFIGQGVGFLGNGATNIIAPITMIAIAAGALFGDGLAAFFSLHLGQGEPGKAAAGLGGTVTVSAVVGVLLAALSFLFLPQLCGAFGATENILPYALGYGRVIVLGFPAVVLSSAVNAAIRADGSPRFAMVSMMVGAVLDPVFIFCFHWGGGRGGAFHHPQPVCGPGLQPGLPVPDEDRPDEPGGFPAAAPDDRPDRRAGVCQLF